MTTTNTVHLNLSRTFGVARNFLCVACGKQAAEWAYQYTSAAPLVDDRGSPYSEDFDDYAPMCLSCHRTLDANSGTDGARRHREAVRRNGKMIAERLKSDSEFASRMREIGRRSGEMNAARFLSDPEFAARRRELGRQAGLAVQNMPRRCNGCGKVSNPGGLGKHQSATGHKGWTSV